MKKLLWLYQEILRPFCNKFLMPTAGISWLCYYCFFTHEFGRSIFSSFFTGLTWSQALSCCSCTHKFGERGIWECRERLSQLWNNFFSITWYFLRVHPWGSHLFKWLDVIYRKPCLFGRFPIFGMFLAYRRTLCPFVKWIVYLFKIKKFFKSWQNISWKRRKHCQNVSDKPIVSYCRSMLKC